MQINNVKYRLGIIAVVLIVQFCLQLNQSFAQSKGSGKVLTKPLENKSNNVSKDSALQILQKKQTDTTQKKIISKQVNTIDSLKFSKDSLDAPVKYKAQDSGVLIMATREFFLYGKSNVKYNTVNLDANTIQYNGNKKTVKAFGAMDSTNSPINRAKMQDGENTTYADTLEYSFQTQKGRTVNSYYTEGELFVNAQILKKVDSNSFYGYKARFTTCNLDTPHFAFRTNRMKMINNKLAVSGPAFPEFEGVPIPIGIPFGIYPLNRGRHSGVLAPQFVTLEDRGIGLENLGYYKVLNNNLDITLRTNIYSYGGWSLNINPKYIVRYKYSGSLSISVLHNKTLNRNTAIKDEFNEDKNFQVLWNHQRDNKARPGTTFSASVNFSSTQYNRNNISNPINTYNNITNSSISYSKSFNQKANINIALLHNQNANTRLVNLTLPSLTFSMQTLYPFQKKEAVGKTKWHQNIGIGYNNSFTNNISYYDSAVTFKKLIDTIRWHASHQIPISVALPALGPVIITPSISYSEEWWDRSYDLQWSDAKKKVDTAYNKAFLRDVHSSFGFDINTRIFGKYIFKHSKNIKALRHEIAPSIKYSYTPNLASRNNYNVKVDTLNHYKRISKFTGGEVFNEVAHGSIGFNINNIFELKVRDKTDTTGKLDKKIRLFDFNISNSYNLNVDSFALGNFALRFNSNIFPNVNFSATSNIDPYVYDSLGFRKNTLIWNTGKFSLGRFTTTNVTLGTQLKSKPTDAKKAKQKTNPNDPFMTADEQQRQIEYARSNPAEFTDFNIPWTLSLNYSLTITNSYNSTLKSFATATISSINFNGDFNLSPKWKLGATGNYNVSATKLESLNFFISREMHCWQLSINVTPVNLLRSFSITISPKSGMLRDLKINRTRQFTN